MKKKILGLLLVLVMFVPCAIIFSACGPAGECDEHTYKITREPTLNYTGEYCCSRCGSVGFVFPKLNDVDYVVSSENPDYITYEYLKDGESFTFARSNFNITFNPQIGGYEVERYSGVSNNVIIPNTYVGVNGEHPIKRICEEAFLNKTNIEQITLPSSLEEINYASFKGCSGLEAINIPETLEYIGTEAFAGCSSLTKIVLPNSLTRMGGDILKGCVGLKEISVPFVGSSSDKVGYFGYLFGDVNSNEDVPDSVEKVIITGNVYIDNNAFCECDKIKTVILGDGVSSVGSYAFYDCHDLKTVKLGKNVGRVYASAFELCGNIESIVIPESLTVIDNAAFKDCVLLDTIYYESDDYKWRYISVGTYMDYNQYFLNANVHFYLETEPTALEFIQNDCGEFWHYNNQNEAELWEMNFTTYASGKSYLYYKTEVSITDDYWYMLQSAKEAGQLGSLFDNNEEQIAMVEESATKEEYEGKIAEYSQKVGTNLVVSFDGSCATLSQEGEATSLVDYVEIDSVVYYIEYESKAYVVDVEKNVVYEEYSSQYHTVRHYYSYIEE